MQAVGIIAEYNPFHRGHQFHLGEVRRKFPSVSGIIIAMSGSFTQRGTIAILDKWVRARHAVAGGADLVIETPFVFCCRSAQDFARGGVSLLAKLGIVKYIAFGTETDDLSILQKIANQIDTAEIQHQLHERIANGYSYAVSLEQSLMQYSEISKSILRTPNNILAIEYLRALRTMAPNIRPIGIQRTIPHNDRILHNGITSASSIRNALYMNPPPWEMLSQNVTPSVLHDISLLYTTGLPSHESLLLLLKYMFLSLAPNELQHIYGISEGIENRIRRILFMAANYNAFLQSASTKRYTRSRIARLIPYILLHIQKKQLEKFDAQGAVYVRPLAFNERGRTMLRSIKEHTTLPIITRTATFLKSEPYQQHTILQQMLSFDIRATELRLLTMPIPPHSRTDFLISPQFIS